MEGIDISDRIDKDLGVLKKAMVCNAHAAQTSGIRLLDYSSPASSLPPSTRDPELYRSATNI